MTEWQIEYYTSKRETSPVVSFIDSLPLKTQAKLYWTFELLREYNIFLTLPWAKKIRGTPLWELRILDKSSVRFLYYLVGDKTFMILHGFVKKQQKIPRKEIKTAIRRYQTTLVIKQKSDIIS